MRPARVSKHFRLLILELGGFLRHVLVYPRIIDPRPGSFFLLVGSQALMLQGVMRGAAVHTKHGALWVGVMEC